jgi:hypothetical protein
MLVVTYMYIIYLCLLLAFIPLKAYQEVVLEKRTSDLIIPIHPYSFISLK